MVLLPIKTLATGAIQGATSMRILSWRGRAGIVLHTVLVFWVFWILPYRTMRRAKLAALGLDDAAAAAAPLVMPYLVLRMCCLFTCFQTTLGAFFGVFTQCTHLTVESMAAAASAAASHRSWAKRQVETAANFASGSLLWFILSGGLNLQVSQSVGWLVRGGEGGHGVRLVGGYYASFLFHLPAHTCTYYLGRAPPLPVCLPRHPPPSHAHHPAALSGAQRRFQVRTRWPLGASCLGIQREHSHKLCAYTHPPTRTHTRSYPTFGDLLAAVLEYFGRLATEEQQSQGKAKAM